MGREKNKQKKTGNKQGGNSVFAGAFRHLLSTLFPLQVPKRCGRYFVSNFQPYGMVTYECLQFKHGGAGSPYTTSASHAPTRVYLVSHPTRQTYPNTPSLKLMMHVSASQRTYTTIDLQQQSRDESHGQRSHPFPVGINPDDLLAWAVSSTISCTDMVRQCEAGKGGGSCRRPVDGIPV